MVVEKIAESIVKKQLEIGMLEESDVNVYKYGYILAIEAVLNILIGIVLGIIFHALDIVLLFWATYIPLRTHSGGWHAKDTWICTVVSNLTLMFVVCIVPYGIYEKYQIQCIVIQAIIMCVIIILAPVDTQAKRLSQNDRKRYKRKVALIMIAEMILALTILKTRDVIFWVDVILVFALLLQITVQNRLEMRR